MVVLTIILTHVKCSRLLPSIMTLDEFLQDAAQFTSYQCLDQLGKKARFCLVL